MATEMIFTADPPNSLTAATEISDQFHWDTTRPVSAQHTNTAIPQRADLAPHIARQLLEVIPQAGQRPVEIALSPAELGRVRMSVAAEDGKVAINILAERPDTLDLMRRHIDQLAQTFRGMGYDQVSFSFGQGAANGDQSGHANGDDKPDQPVGSKSGNTASSTDINIIDLDQVPATGIDIRL